MNRTIIFVSSFSIAVASVIGWIRFKKLKPAFHPFVFLLWAGLLNEIISTYLTPTNTALNTNVYYLIEGVLVLYFLRNQQAAFSTRAYAVWTLLLVVVWAGEISLIHAAREFVSVYVVVHSLAIVLLSIQQIDREIGTRSKPLTQNPVFLICACFVVYFTFAIIVEVIWKYNFFSRRFKANLQTLLSFVNIITNLLYAVALLWMPKKQKFSLSSSC